MDVKIMDVDMEVACKWGRKYRSEHVDFKPNAETRYIGAFIEGSLVGIVGWQRVGSTMRYKGDCVAKEHRGNGIYRMLFEEREKRCKGICDTTTAFCTRLSIGTYLKKGFEIVSENKNEIKFVRR